MVILKFILIMVVMIGMIVLLMSVRALGHPSETIDKKEADQMRRDIDMESSPITSRSVFSTFLARDRNK